MGMGMLLQWGCRVQPDQQFSFIWSLNINFWRTRAVCQNIMKIIIYPFYFYCFRQTFYCISWVNGKFFGLAVYGVPIII
jgi:hypothetical protein